MFTSSFLLFGRCVMAGSAMCVSCAQLPVKDRAVATKMQLCSDCQAFVGVTSYGARFRVKPLKNTTLLTPLVVQRAAVGGGLFMLVLAMVALGLWSNEHGPKDRSVAAPRVVSPVQQLALAEYARIPEVSLEDPLPVQID